MVIDFDIAAVAVFAIIFINSTIKYKKEYRKNQLFRGLVLMALISTVFDIVSAITITHAQSVPLWINYVTNTGYFAAEVLAAFIFVAYIRSFHEKAKLTIVSKLFLFIPLVAFMLMLIANLWTGWVFFFDESMTYTHGYMQVGENRIDTYFIVLGVPYYYFTFSLIDLFVFRRYYSRKQFVSALTYIGVVFVITTSQVFIFSKLFEKSILLTNFGSALALLAMMITLETPDYQKLIGIRDELEVARQEAEKAKTAKSEFLANMSHEIRTPINGMLGMNRIILKEKGISPEVRECAQNIDASGNSLLNIVNDILDLSKLESGKMELVTGECSVQSLMNSLYHMTSGMAMDKGLQFFMSNNTNMPSRVICDENRMRQILFNLVNNAIRYTKTGSVTIYFSGKMISEDEVLFSVFIQDTGEGIPVEEIEALMEGRNMPNGDMMNDNTRMNLNITKRFVDMMQGTIDFESEPEQGTDVRLEIPMPVVKGAKAMGKFVPMKVEEEEEKVLYAPDAQLLVVDDVAMNLRVIQGLLKDTAIKIDLATGGRLTLEKIREKHYDLIFLDHMMPEMDGVETLQHILSEKDHLNVGTPIIVLTANAMDKARETYMGLGFHDYLAKPVKEAQLKAMIMQYLPADKLSMQVEEATPTVATASVSAAPNNGKKSFREVFSFLDIESGMNYMADDEALYLEILQSCLAERKDKVIAESFEEGDWTTYQINVHALKGIYLSVGAGKFSAQARDVEQAAKKGEIEFVKEHHAALMDAYLELLKKIETALKEI